MNGREGTELLAGKEVAVLFKVDAKTVARWGAKGWLLTGRTPGGLPRYFAVEVRALLAGETREAARKLAEAERDRLPGGGP